MKPYRGLIRINCGAKKCIEDKTNMDALCMSCTHRSSKLVDLEEKTLFVFDKIKKPTIIKKEK